MHGAQPDALVLCHEIGRKHIRHLPHAPLPSIEQTLEANLQAAKLTNSDAQFVGICLNTSAISVQDAEQLCLQWSEKYAMPVTDPVRFGVESIAQCLATW